MIKKIAVTLGVAALAVLGFASPASAHVPAINVTCEGVVLHAENYDGSKQNTWVVSIDGVEQSGTFGATLDKTIPVPQEGRTSTVGAQIADADQTPEYSTAFAGPVGPCGEVPPVVPPKPADEPFGTSSESPADCTTGVVSTQVVSGFFGFTLVDNVWVKDAEPTITSDVTTTRPVTIEECPLPTDDTTPVNPESNPAPPKTEQPEALAYTGAREEMIAKGAWLATGLISGAGGLFWLRRKFA